jgi:hypothetical protein
MSSTSFLLYFVVLELMDDKVELACPEIVKAMLSRNGFSTDILVQFQQFALNQ